MWRKSLRGIQVALARFGRDMKMIGETSRCNAAPIKWAPILFFTVFVWRPGPLPAAPGAFQTPLSIGDLDRSTFAELVGGKEKSISGEDKSRQPAWVMWSQGDGSGYSGLAFGNTAASGARHLRIGFTRPISIGSVLVLGDVRVSVLKAGAPYPGSMADDAQWVPAQRIKVDQVVSEQPARNDYSVWILPSVLQTRALRFTHEAAVEDTVYGGWLGGAYVLAERFANVAIDGSMTATASNQYAGRMNNEGGGGIWQAWANLTDRDRVRVETIAAKPEWITLVWPHPETLAGLGLLAAGFSAAEIQIYTGPAGQHPREAREADWKTIKNIRGLKNQFPRILAIDWIDFEGTMTTRAVRLRLTAVTNEGHPHMKGLTVEGKRVWLGGLMAMAPLGSASASTALRNANEPPQHAPIAINFTLPADGEVTLVVEDEAGNRVRNLLAATPFPKGKNTVYWDGSTDTGRDLDAAAHGVYNIPNHLVAPGNYRVRGLWHKSVNLSYEFSVNSEGNPPWPTSDGAGGWTTNHTPPSSMLSVPGKDAPSGKPLVFIGSYVSEGGAALAWVDLEGKKQGGRGWIGGNWTGAQYLARDAGANADPTVYAYVGAAWRSDPAKNENEIRLTGLRQKDGDRAVLHYVFAGKGKDENMEPALGGLAVHDGLLVFSQTSYDQLVAANAKSGEVIGKQELTSPRGVAFDSEGRLLVLTGNRLLRYRVRTEGAFILDSEETLVADLDDPCGITLNEKGEIYVSERGSHHQVRMLAATGQLLRAFGRAGIPQAGPYQSDHMNNPRGLAVDANGRLWVAEEDFQPKRVSVWNPDGSLWKAFYGPPRYGGGGSIDPEDKTCFDYDGMEFRLDWATGQSRLDRVIYRPTSPDRPLASGESPGSPQTPFYIHGHRYLTNAFTQNPTNGSSTAFIFMDNGYAAVPVAGMGRAENWRLLQQPNFESRWSGVQGGQGGSTKKGAFFVWSDLNGDGQVEPDEVTLYPAECGGVTVQRDGSFRVARLSFAATKGNAMSFSPIRFTAAGAPVYDFNAGKVLVEDINIPLSTGGDQVLTGANGWTIFTTAPKPFSPAGLGGVRDGVPRWSYPSLWPGLHASHSAPTSEIPGELIGTTRLLGDFVTPKNSEAGPLFFINGNLGNIYVFAADGLFVTSLLQDRRLGKPWSMPLAQHGMLLNDISPDDEHFFPTINQTRDSSIYLVAGKIFSAIVHVEGLETVRRIPSQPLMVSAQMLKQAEEFASQNERARQAEQGTDTLRISLRSSEPRMDDQMADWEDADWVDIDRRGVAANFGSKSKPYAETGAMAISDSRLFAIWRTDAPNLLENSGAIENAPFRTGGALDLMLGTDPMADARRTEPVKGDLRLIVSKVNGRPKALLYRAVVPGTGLQAKVQFNSPWRTVSFDRVDDVSKEVALATDGKGNYELSVALSLLGLQPQAEMKIKGDMGILHGNGNETIRRSYWSNKATAIFADLPSEAMLTPQLWGTLRFETPPKTSIPSAQDSGATLDSRAK